MNELNKVLEDNEKVLWEGNPNFWPFVSQALPVTVFGLIFLAFVFGFMSFNSTYFGDSFFDSFNAAFSLFNMIFLGVALLLMGAPAIRAFSYKYTHYAITNKRVLIQSGIIGRDFQFIDFDQITNARVDVGIFDKIHGNSGSILLYSAGTVMQGKHGLISAPYTLSNIKDPYEVFKHFKKVAYDIKTDIQYPNKYRPRTNPGYRTEYKSV